MRPLADITPRQIRVLEVLWRRPGVSAVDVTEALSGDELARTTIATKLARMVQYGWVRRERSGREVLFRAVVTRGQVRAAQVGKVVGSLFADDLPSFVSHALESGDWDGGDLDRIEAMLAAYRERGGGR